MVKPSPFTEFREACALYSELHRLPTRVVDLLLALVDAPSLDTTDDGFWRDLAVRYATPNVRRLIRVIGQQNPAHLSARELLQARRHYHELRSAELSKGTLL